MLRHLKLKKDCFFILFLIFASTIAFSETRSDFGRRPDTDILYNPGIGLSDFHHQITPYPYDTAARPTGQLAYYRFYWRNLEPTEGNYDFTSIDSAIAIAAQRKQALGIRIMSAKQADSDNEDTVRIPPWLKSKIEGGGGSAGNVLGTAPRQYFFPNYNNAIIIDAAQKLMNALSSRYKGNSHLYFIDVGMIGLWGEWHDGTGNISGLMPTLENAKQYVDMHYQAFPTKSLVMLIGDGKSTSTSTLQYAANMYGMSWRADCWGDYRFLDTSHENWTVVYPKVLSQSPEINMNWSKSPVLLEACGTIPQLYNKCYDTHDPIPVHMCNDDSAMLQAFDFAITHHVSSINTSPSDAREIFPASIKNAYLTMVARLGYRYLLTTTQFPTTIVQGQQSMIGSTWKNIGIAPVYANFKIAYRLRDTVNTSSIVKQWSNNASDLKTWLPVDSGGQIYTDTLTVLASDNIPAGTYKLDIAILSEAGNPIQLAVSTAQQTDGWYEVGGPINVATDSDHDGVPDTMDNCPTIVNQNQSDLNQDGIGDACTHGLTGAYYNNKDLFGAPAIMTLDPVINFNWGAGKPNNFVGNDFFSVRWTGKVIPPVTGTYKFCTRTDDGVKLIINGSTLFNYWIDQSATDRCGNIALTQNQAVTVQLEYYENAGDAVAKLSWSYPGQAKIVIPSTQLYAQ